MTSRPVRVRYAPSPTGDFHVGGARTALFNYLFARHHGGRFILRIEDTDRKRYNPQALDWLLEGLRFLGLDWDEGPEAGGAYGPYVQSERIELYRRHAELLLEREMAYRCFCAQERAEASSPEPEEPAAEPGEACRCGTLSAEESRRRANGGASHAVRFRAPRAGSVTVHDAIRGDITFPNEVLRDAVLLKSDGFPTYHLANVVDDHFMEISHILRGDEWLASLPLHVHLYRAFGWEPPVMAHLPLILNPTGKGKLSKREERAPDGSLRPVFVRQFRELGYLPEALVNFMALLGWSYDDKTEIMSRSELIERFTLERVNPAPAVWNYEKLDHFNGHYIRQLSIEDLAGRLMPFFEAAGYRPSREQLLAVVPLIRERITRLADAPAVANFFFDEELAPYPVEDLIPQKADAAMALAALERARAVLAEVDFRKEAIETALRAEAARLGVKTGQMFQPIRVAVCGRKAAPPLFETLEVVGRDRCLRRIDKAVEKLRSGG